jgi:hypothetical protein
VAKRKYVPVIVAVREYVFTSKQMHGDILPEEEPEAPTVSGIAIHIKTYSNKNKQTPWPESASELYRPSDCRLSAK